MSRLIDLYILLLSQNQLSLKATVVGGSNHIDNAVFTYVKVNSSLIEFHF